MDFLFPVGVVAASLVLYWARQTALPALVASRIRRGHDLGVPVTVTPPTGRRRRARAVVDGNSLRILARHEDWLVPATVFDAGGRRTLEDDDLRWTVPLVLDSGQAASMSVAGRWQDSLDLLVARARTRTTEPDPNRSRRRVPLWATSMAALFAVPLALWLALLLRTTERVSPVLAVNGEYGECRVRWSEAGQTFTGWPMCDPLPAVGDPLTYWTTPWPFTGNAWDTETPVVLAALLGVGVLVGVARVLWGLVPRRPARVHRARPAATAPLVPTGTGAPTTRAGAGAGAGAVPGSREESVVPGAPDPGAGLVPLVEHAREALGWDVVPEHHPRSGTGWRTDLLHAVSTVRWWPAVAGFIAWLWLSEETEGWQASLAPVTLVAGFLLLAWAVAMAVRSLLAFRRAWAAPFTSSWSFRGIGLADDTWVLVLFLGPTPAWLVPLPGRPPLVGTCMVRGDLGGSGVVHLQIGTDVWVPSGPALRFEAEDADELAEDLRWQLGLESD